MLGLPTRRSQCAVLGFVFAASIWCSIARLRLIRPSNPEDVNGLPSLLFQNHANALISTKKVSQIGGLRSHVITTSKRQVPDPNRRLQLSVIVILGVLSSFPFGSRNALTSLQNRL